MDIPGLCRSDDEYHERMPKAFVFTSAFEI